MQPIQINVTIGVSEELKALLQPIVEHLQQQSTAPAEEPVRKIGFNTDEAKEVTEYPILVPEEPAAEPIAAPAEQPAVKSYTEVDVRAAMDAARKRIEGEGWKENPDSEGYKKYHRPLTAWFKETAALYGAEKPSALPDSESRGKFIAACERVRVDNDGTITDLPY